MTSGTETLFKKTQRGLSILAFETTKQSRILKKRMRIAALQKEIKADLRDLGNLVYNSVINNHPGILGEEEVKILVQNIQHNKAEVERLRDSIGRLSKAKKHFTEDEAGEEIVPSDPDEQPVLVVEPVSDAPTWQPSDASVDTERELKAAVLDTTPLPSEVEAKGKKKSSVPPAQGADVEGTRE